MASFSKGTSFTDGVTGDVTAAKLHALVDAATPVPGFITDRTAETSIADDDLVLISDTSESGALNKMTVANFTNIVSTGTGTAAGPAIRPTGDTNTGIFFPAADTIAFSEGGTESMRIDSSGNVGIGGSPSTLLNIIKDDRANGAVLRLTNSAESSSWVSGDIIGDIDFFSSDSSGSGVRGRIRSVSEGGATNPNSVAMSFWTYSGGNVSERLRIDSSGNVGIGVTSPSVAWSGDAKALQINGSGTQACGARVSNANGSAELFISGTTSLWGLFSSSNLPFALYTNNTERLRIDSSGNVLVGTTTITGVGGWSLRPNLGGAGTYPRMEFNSNQGADIVKFLYSGTEVGRINSGTSSVSYVTTSDYRLKTNLEPISNGIDRIKQLPVYRFNWIIDQNGSKVDGFVAHEAQAIVPECVTGEKDAVDADGKPIYQGIDQSKIVPLLTAALKEAIAKIETLETKVAALESA